MGEGDRIAKQFWGDIFANLLHLARSVLSATDRHDIAFHKEKS